MVIYGVSFDMVGKQPIVLLKTVSGNRFLPIWIGHAEAAAILMKLQGAETPRPMTHDLLNDVVSRAERGDQQDHRDRASREHLLRAHHPAGRRERDRDRLAAQRRAGARGAHNAPIFAADKVIEESGIEFEHEVEDTDEVVEKFKEFLDQVSPDDFLTEES